MREKFGIEFDFENIDELHALLYLIYLTVDPNKEAWHLTDVFINKAWFEAICGNVEKIKSLIERLNKLDGNVKKIVCLLEEDFEKSIGIDNFNNSLIRKLQEKMVQMVKYVELTKSMTEKELEKGNIAHSRLYRVTKKLYYACKRIKEAGLNSIVKKFVSQEDFVNNLKGILMMMCEKGALKCAVMDLKNELKICII